MANRVKITEEELQKMENSRINTTAFINHEVGKMRHENEALQNSHSRWEKIIGDNLQNFESRLQNVESQKISTGSPNDEMVQNLLQEFGNLRKEWLHQKAVLQNIQQNVLAKIEEKNDHPQCDAALKNMWEQAQIHIGQLTARITLLEQKKSVPEKGEIPRQVTSLQGDLAQLHQVVDTQVDITNNVHSRLERLEAQIQQEGVPELRANFYGLHRNFEALAQSYHHIRDAVQQILAKGQFSAVEPKKKSVKKLHPLQKKSTLNMLQLIWC